MFLKFVDYANCKLVSLIQIFEPNGFIIAHKGMTMNLFIPTPLSFEQTQMVHLSMLYIHVSCLIMME